MASNVHKFIVLASVAIMAGAVACCAAAAPARAEWKFSFGRKGRRGYTGVHAGDSYETDTGFGFVGSNNGSEQDRSLCGEHGPLLFAADVPEGNYNVQITLGDDHGSTSATVKAEARRLVFGHISTRAKTSMISQATVSVRYKELKNGTTVHLKRDEQGDDLDWDHRLELEFNGSRPCIRAVHIKKTDDAVTVYIAGDSTVTDQRKEPWAAWGQMLPSFFREGVAVANEAESGESLRSFVAEKRLEKIMETIKPGDYLFIQFAHNDQKPGRSHVDAATTYKDVLKEYIAGARSKQAIPVLVTSMHRRRFDDQGHIVNTLEGYPDAMRQLAAEEKVALIDLNAMSKTLFEALGPDGTLKAFVHYPAHTFPGQDQPLADNTHFNSYGAYELARCVVDGIRQANLGIAKYLNETAKPFDPSHPDPPDAWNLPASPVWTGQKPEGN